MLKIIVTALQVLVGLGLISTVILQSGRSAGISGAIAGGAEAIFGRKKSKGLDELLNRLTTVLAVLFMILTLTLALMG
ncbi:MAG TPA: preprotein translocase subunit SecG [Syntrophothermus lipocalidus]|uniref:Protein-export membrane protein SecG n=1 Tax=Syntrophothermus lipocalidus (strain DSM 12680 / TGB-C1) TaxID=643648 RepID=D7CPG6_SYNLT|nr:MULTISPECIES: preprotein translocase subunit SecG [Syntrophothermus]ADI02601.1 preprotein translocase, SecG subunit [Syntrophothermus lipocalidus DSM 12680]NSW84069.1 preprotein translocase subunit SecG [Syntrophothermus sp.]HHV76174.1 preprotein translocase subunit SecG [Syntrophothermus lipocalidus]HOV43673.1 preprotein translocase subunit SecG [Syntrophothermus lipocalidus]